MAPHAQGAERKGAALLLVIVTTSLTMLLVLAMVTAACGLQKLMSCSVIACWPGSAGAVV